MKCRTRKKTPLAKQVLIVSAISNQNPQAQVIKALAITIYLQNQLLTIQVKPAHTNRKVVKLQKLLIDKRAEVKKIVCKGIVMDTNSKVKPQKIQDSTQVKQDTSHKDYESTSYSGSEVSNKYGTANKEEDVKNAIDPESKTS